MSDQGPFDNIDDMVQGNIEAETEEKTRFHGWSFGNFVNWSSGRPDEVTDRDARREFGLRYTDTIEVKWSHHPAGQPRSKWWSGKGVDSRSAYSYRALFSFNFAAWMTGKS